MNKSPLQPRWKNTGLNDFRFRQIESYISNKKILDIGSAVGYRSKNWMHGLIQEKAASVLGIDIDQASVDEIRKNGYNIICADAQSFDLKDKFEVVHAGELIEHLDNFHGFLQCSKSHLMPDGILILTTPNAMRIGNLIYSTFGGLHVNAEHTCWFCETTITQLLKRNGYEVIRVDFIRHESKGLIRKTLSKIIRSILPDRVVWNTLLTVARPVKS